MLPIYLVWAQGINRYLATYNTRVFIVLKQNFALCLRGDEHYRRYSSGKAENFLVGILSVCHNP